MGTKLHSATVKRVQGLQFEAEARGMKVIVDEPEQMGGTNLGMNPVELLLCSLGTCQAITLCLYASFYGITIDDVQVEVEGDRDDGKDPKAAPGYQEIRCHLHIKSSASEERIKQLLQVVEKKCPVGDTLIKGVRMGETKLTLTT